MAIGSDWDINFAAKLISHIDGVLNYDTGSGTQPTVGAVIRGATSGALGKILARTGTAASGTFTLTDVEGRFQDNEALAWCDSVAFDGVTNSGFVVGNTITGATSGRSGVVRKIDYIGPNGTAYSEQFGAGSWTDNENIQVGGQTRALANGAGADNSSAWSSALVNEGTTGTIHPPTISGIINYDGGTIAIPRFAKVKGATSAATGIAQKSLGVIATGSLRLVDVTGTWANDENLQVMDLINYNGKTNGGFKVGDLVKGNTSLATGKVLTVRDDGDNTGQLVLQNQVGTFTAAEQLHVVATDGTTQQRGALENTTFVETRAVVNGTLRKKQIAAKGGLYAESGTDSSLNVVRDCNALYTYVMDTFDELGQMDDTVPMTAQVKLQQYTLVNGWRIPDLSYRFLESGSIQDSNLDNIWTNYQTLGTVEGIGDTVYAATSPQPQIYVFQNGVEVPAWWLEGHIDVLVKNKTNTDMTLTATVDGVLVDSGNATIFCRNYSHTFAHFTTATLAGVAPCPLSTSADLNNTTGTHSAAWDGGSAATFTVGEEITSGSKRAIVTAQTGGAGATGTVQYVLLSTSNFADNDALVGQSSGKTADVNGAPSALVAGYGTDIVFATVEGTLTHGAVTGTFTPGEAISQAVSGATGVFMKDSAGTMTIGNVTGTFNNTNVITGASSGATTTSSSTLTTATSATFDVNDGNGLQPYNAVVFCNRTGSNARTLAAMYQWLKYLTAKESTTVIGGPGTSDTGRQGRFYLSLATSYAVVPSSPIGTFAGGTFFGARGVFVYGMAASDVRAYQIIDANGVLRTPPNLQTLAVTGVVSGDRVGVYRTSGGLIVTNELALDTVTGDHNGSGDAFIQVTGTIATDVPDAGVVRIYNATTGVFDRYSYSSLTRAAPGRFALSGTLSQDYVAADPVYVPLLEQQASGSSVSTTIVYVSDVPILTRVRKKGIQPFEASGTFGSSGASVGAVRTADTIVD